MNKTVTINISGIIFHIEEDAYEKLGNYLRTVRNRFSAEEGRDEIMADIESRIAEILGERVGPSKQVVVMADVDHVISLMGEPEAISDNETKTEEKSAPREETREETTQRRQRRRFFRDPDDKVIGGVCSGLGHYFDIDPVWIRIGFVVLVALGGSGILFYLLLMIIIPKAETTAEKLEMRGEPVDVNNISRTIREDFEDLKKRMENFGEDAKQYGRKWKEESGEWRRRNRGGVEDFFRSVFNLIGRIFAFALVLFGVLFLIGLLLGLFSLSSLGMEEFGDTVRNLFPDGMHYGLAIAAGLLVFGIPILMMIYKGIRLLFRIKRSDKIVAITALVLWIGGVGLGVYAIVSVGKGFADEQRVHTYFPLENPHMDTLYLNVKVDPEMENENYNASWNQEHHFVSRWKMVCTSGKVVKFGNQSLQIVPSMNDSFQLVVYRYAHGANPEEAQARANAITYNIAQDDSLLTFDSFFTLGKGQHWRAQEVRMELRVPRNKVIYIGPALRDMLNDVDNVSNTLDGHMVDRRWKMTDKGLACVDCAGLELEETKTHTPESFEHPAEDSFRANH